VRPPAGKPAPPPVKGRVRASHANGRHGRVALRVTTPGAGQVTVSGSGLRTVRQKVRKAGRYALTVPLTARGRRALARSGHRRVRVRVTFRPAAGATTTTSLTVTVRS
jgi:hypothetical protein